MEQLYCGVDLGTTSLKVLLCDANGNTKATRSCPVPRELIDGTILTDPARILMTVESLLESAWNDVGRQGYIVAIATAGVGEDGFLIDAAGAPYGMSIPWFDQRAESEADELSKTFNTQQRTGIAFESTRTAAKWLWLARHAKMPTDGKMWITLTDWPLIAWTGKPMMTETLAARTACWDVTNHSWLSEALIASGAPTLPSVVKGGAIVGTLAPDSFPVRLGAADIRTIAVAAGHDHPVASAPIMMAFSGAIVDSLGTAELTYAEAPVTLRAETQLVRTIPSVPGMIDACLHVFELDRFLNIFPREQLHAELAADGPYSLLKSDIRDTLERATMVTAKVVERMRRAGIPDGDLFVTGGRARSNRFMQLRADVMNRPILRIEESELCGLGAAIVAAAGTGLSIMPDLAVTKFLPDPEMALVYSRKNMPSDDELMFRQPNVPQ